MIHKSDSFVFYDDVQYDKQGWRNRNRIKTPQGPRWLTIPVHAKGNIAQNIPINQVRLDPSQPWQRKHWTAIKHAYGKTPYFDKYADLLDGFYTRPWVFLADFTMELTMALCAELGIEKTEFRRSSDMNLAGSSCDRLLGLLKELGATHYISGPSARSYIAEEDFNAAGISLEFMEYEYAEYEQLHPPYDPNVSILDLLFMKGPDAPALIWGGDGGD